MLVLWGDTKGEMDCHEEWIYEVSMTSKTGIQHLHALRCVCKMCHSVIHYGRSKRTLSKDQMETLNLHAIRVNGVIPQAWYFHLAEAFINWQKASETVKQWIHDRRGL